jgi:hypothetical protein
MQCGAGPTRLAKAASEGEGSAEELWHTPSIAVHLRIGIVSETMMTKYRTNKKPDGIGILGS